MKHGLIGSCLKPNVSLMNRDTSLHKGNEGKEKHKNEENNVNGFQGSQRHHFGGIFGMWYNN